MVRNNPRGDIYDILARPDLAGTLETDLAAAQVQVINDLNAAWPPDSSPYRAQLAQDVIRAYAEAEASLRVMAIRGFNLVPPAVFVPGVTQPGHNPAMEAAIERARVVSHNTAAAAWYLGFRNEMTVNVAATRYLGEKTLAGAQPGRLKKWECRKGPDGRPDHRVCDWCRYLDSLPPIPADQEFPAGGVIHGRRPPRVYRDLMCPPRHPRCRCRIILVRAGATAPDLDTAGPAGNALPYMTAAHIRAMPEAKYRALHDFIRAALHELGQVLHMHRRVGKR